MASIVRIKRSSTAGSPNVLAQGELAYSALADNGANGGDRLYIGMGTETAGNAADRVVIGGKFFTDMLDHTKGVLTANSAIITDASSKIDNLKVDNLGFDGNSIISTNTNGNIFITPNGTGTLVLDGLNWPQADGTNGQILTTNGAGQLSWASAPASSFTIAGNTGTDSFSTGGTLTFTGTAPIVTAVTNDTVTISATDATTSAKGVASFSSTDFTVSSGAVSVNSSIARLASPAFTGTPTAPTATAGTNTTQVATTEFVQTAVDAARSGLDVKASVKAATTGAITLSNTQTVDGVALSAGDRVLVKDQGTASTNGIYIVASGSWTRATDANTSEEVTPGMFVFVEQGTVNADSGWVLTSDAPITLDVSPLTFAQFSGAGQITAGSGLTKTGNTLNVGAGTGITVNADDVALTGQALAFHNLATNGLVTRTGAGTVTGRTLTGTTDRVTVTNGDGVSGNPTVDIASSYAGQNTITTLGTVTTGTWNGTAIASGYGGTGFTTYSTGDIIFASATNTLSKRSIGTDGQVLQVNSSGVPVWGDIDGGTYA